MDEPKDGLQLALTHKKGLHKQAKGLRKLHPRDCLVEDQENGKLKWTKGVKWKINHEHNNRMWFLIKHTNKGHRSPAVSKVERIINGKKVEYNTKYEVENVI